MSFGLETRHRVVVQNDAVAGTEQDFDAVPSGAAAGPQLEVPNGVGAIVNRQRFRLDERSEHVAPSTSLAQPSAGLRARRLVVGRGKPERERRATADGAL